MPGQARLPSDSTQLECSKFEPKCKLAFLSNSATQPSAFSLQANASQRSFITVTAVKFPMNDKREGFHATVLRKESGNFH